MAINDLITVGATPLVVQAYWAAGGSEWFADAARAEALVAGWKAACDRCQVAWGGGETPALAGIVEDRPHRSRRRVHRPDPAEGAAVARRCARARRRDRAARIERHPCERRQPRARARRAPAAGLSDADAAEPRRRHLRRRAARTDDPLFAGDRSAGRGRHRSALPREHHRPRLAQAAAPSRGAALPHPHAARRAAGAAVHPASRPIRMRARPTAPSTWARDSRSSCTPTTWRARVDVAHAQGVRAWHAGNVEAGPKELIIEPLDLVFSGGELQLR